MDLYPTAETWTGAPGAIAPADGNARSDDVNASAIGAQLYPESNRGNAASLLGTVSSITCSGGPLDPSAAAGGAHELYNEIFLIPTRLSLHLIEILLAAALAAIVVTAWQADRRDRAQLAADLAAAKQAFAETDARQHDRDAQLGKTLATLAAGTRTVTTPAQIVTALPNEIPFPIPITLQPQNPASGPQRAPCSSGLPWKGPNCGPEGLDSTRPHNSVSVYMSPCH